MRFRLSTALLLTAIAAISTGWYVDQHADKNRELLGTWYYPTGEGGAPVPLDTSELSIRKDGTFTKVQSSRSGSEAFSGTYVIKENGRVDFHVLSASKITKLYSRDEFGNFISVNREPIVTQLDLHYPCRCAVDSAGYLMIEENEWLHRYSTDLRWKTHVRERE